MNGRQRLTRLEAHPQYQQALAIIQRLASNGHRSVLAGGCVRDSLLGHAPKDLDLATSALPDAVEAAFPRTLAVGKAFGTIVVVDGGHNFEVTTFRADGDYLDGRHPSKVTFTDMEEDAKRRDFTVNALFYDPLTHEVIDFVDGQADLGARVLRTVGSAKARFAEDALRMLRAARFVGQLGFDLDPAALKAIAEAHQDMAKVSVERVFNELKRLLASDHFMKGMGVLLSAKLDAVVWPEIHGLDVDRLLPFPRFINWENAFAAVCVLIPGLDAETRLRLWKAPRESARRVQSQLQAIKVFSDLKCTRADRARILGGEIYAEFMVLAQGIFSEAKIKHWVDEYLEVADSQGQLPRPWLNGEDLLAAGILPGAQMGKLIRQLFDAQLEGRLHSRSEALEELKALAANI